MVSSEIEKMKFDINSYYKVNETRWEQHTEN